MHLVSQKRPCHNVAPIKHYFEIILRHCKFLSPSGFSLYCVQRISTQNSLVKLLGNEIPRLPQVCFVSILTFPKFCKNLRMSGCELLYSVIFAASVVKLPHRFPTKYYRGRN